MKQREWQNHRPALRGLRAISVTVLMKGLMTVLVALLMTVAGALPTGTSYADGRILIPTVQKAPPIRHTVIAVQEGDTAAWWQWLERRAGAPLAERGEVDCSLEQRGDLWFLAGTAGGAHVDRSCQVPGDKRFLIPILVASSDSLDDEDLSVAEKRKLLSDIFSDSEPGPFNTKLCLAEASVDGLAVAPQRVQSPPFRFGTDEEAVSDGYWFALQLEPGKHVVAFRGAFCKFDTGEPLLVVDVTYQLAVE